MNKRDLERMVAGVKSPPLDRKQTRLLIDDNQNNQSSLKDVLRPALQGVAQNKPQQVAQAVAQGSWVAQAVPQRVAQSTPPSVAQNKSEQVVQTQADKDVEKFKEQIYQIQTIEGRKRFVLDIGFGIASEKRGGKKIYLYGIKKIDGKKYRLYIGNSTKL
jgi:hypothetical protein